MTVVRRALHGHAAIGLLAGALLYLVALTGSLAVVHDQWARWEQPSVPEMTALSPDAAGAALAWAGHGAPSAALSLQLPTGDLPRAVVTNSRGSWYVDAAGRPVLARHGGWSEFVVDLHETLCLPATWGMTIVGALGVALLALSIIGVLAHPRIVRDAFRLRARGDTQVARVDWHNRLGVWTLPFALAVALTGAFLGLSGVGTTLMARLDASDAERVYAPVFGGAASPDARPAPLADVAAVMRTLTTRAPDTAPTLVIVRAPGTRGQDVGIYAILPHRLIFGELYRFDARGGWKGAVGLSDGAIGEQFAASTYDLHFGNFGGLLVEAAYVLLGLCLCAITATGTSIWLGKRRARGHGSDRLEACWTCVIWGWPLILLVCLWGSKLVGPKLPLPALFWITSAVALAIGVVRPGWISARRLRALVGVSAAATAVAHLLLARPVITGPLLLDLALLSFGLLMLASRRQRSAKTHSDAAPLLVTE